MTHRLSRLEFADCVESSKLRLLSQLCLLRNCRTESIDRVHHDRLPRLSIQHLIERIKIHLGLDADHDRGHAFQRQVIGEVPVDRLALRSFSMVRLDTIAQSAVACFATIACTALEGV